ADDVAASRALPDSDYLYVSDSELDDIVGIAGVPARGAPTTLPCSAAVCPGCPPGTGVPGGGICWKVPLQGDNGMLDVINLAVGGELHGTMGFPDLNGWPAWDVYTAQQAYYTWLQRAHDHGLKFMTMHAVNNRLLCTLAPHRLSYGCDDDSAVLRQI